MQTFVKGYVIIPLKKYVNSLFIKLFIIDVIWRDLPQPEISGLRCTVK